MGFAIRVQPRHLRGQVEGRSVPRPWRACRRGAVAISVAALASWASSLALLASPKAKAPSKCRAPVIDAHVDPDVKTALAAWPDVVALDTEFVGVGRNTARFGGSRNALARVSVVGPNEQVLLDTTVRVPEKIADFRLAITGLTQDSLDVGIEWEEARSWVAHLIHGRRVVGHNLKSDWQVLNLTHPPELIRDTAFYKPLRARRPEEKRRYAPKLAYLASEWLDLDMQQGFHDSVEDAATALDLYLMMRQEWEQSLEGTDTASPPGENERPAKPSKTRPPTGAGKLVAGIQKATVKALRNTKNGANAQLQKYFERKANYSKNDFAALHYERVARTFSALPYTVSCEDDLQRPELACIGKKGTASYKAAMSVITAFQKSKPALAS